MATYFVSIESQKSWTRLTQCQHPSLISNCSALWNSQKVMEAAVLTIRNGNQKGLCAWEHHRALLCSLNTRKNIFHFAISLVITEKKVFAQHPAYYVYDQTVMKYHTDVTKLSPHLLFYQLCSGEEIAGGNSLSSLIKAVSCFLCSEKKAGCELSTFRMQPENSDVDRCGLTLKWFRPDTWGKVLTEFQEQMY